MHLSVFATAGHPPVTHALRYDTYCWLPRKASTKAPTALISKSGNRNLHKRSQHLNQRGTTLRHKSSTSRLKCTTPGLVPGQVHDITCRRLIVRGLVRTTNDWNFQRPTGRLATASQQTQIAQLTSRCERTTATHRPRGQKIEGT